MSEQQKNLDQLQEESKEEIQRTQQVQAEVQAKEKQLEVERKRLRQEKDTAIFKLEDEMKAQATANASKLLMSSAVCFFVGVAVAMTLLS